jgi:hypothetical protein
LDFDWRFSEASVQLLLCYIENLSLPNEQIVLLGTPTILRAALEAHLKRQFLLVEANDSVLQPFATSNHEAQVLKCDLFIDPLPSLSARLVIADPPWYEDYTWAFLWAASYVCARGGTVLLSKAPVGIRPDIETEWSRTVQWAEQVGLTLRDMQQGVLRYALPPFEYNALRALQQPSVVLQWRKGDFAILERTHQCTVDRPRSLSISQEWVEHKLQGIRWRIRQDASTTFANPALVSVVPGDILPSVSRRDGRRNSADVWTSGNRIFRCEGRHVFRTIVQALGEHVLPLEAVSGYLGRKLTLDETHQVRYAERQVEEVVESELSEYLLAGQG